MRIMLADPPRAKKPSQEMDIVSEEKVRLTLAEVCLALLPADIGGIKGDKASP